jgi:NADH-quinone oxidoreductase subunit A
MSGVEYYFPIVLMGGLAVATAVGLFVVSSTFGPTRRKSREKFETYECGAPLLDSARRRFGVKFYVVALIFLLFDIEAVFLIPWAVMYKKLGKIGLFEIIFFILVLGLGLVYLYRKGALEWE